MSKSPTSRCGFILSRILWPSLIGGLLLTLLMSCTQAIDVPQDRPSPSVPPIVLTLGTSPITLCQTATQLSLDPQVIKGMWTSEREASWTLQRQGTLNALSQGIWSPEDGKLFIAFPEGNPLLPGTYQVTLTLDEMTEDYVFIIPDISPQFTALTLALTPDGPNITALPLATRNLYLRYVFEGVCPGAPLWMTLTWDGKLICKQNVILDADHGNGALPCYRAGGVPFEPGEYRAVLTLMGETTRELTFTLKSPPTPAPTATPLPTPRPVSCDALFTAHAISPEGEPLMANTQFQWYTVAVFVGAPCQNLHEGTPWETKWSYKGEDMRAASGTWQRTTPTGVVWDSYTEALPFLYYGTYTVMMRIGDTPPQTTTFRIIPYTPRE